MSHLVQQAFGREDVNLYEDVLKVAKDCSLAALRKAYYKQALLFHPDKNGDSETAKLKFQAISWTYSFLKCPEKRSDYDKYGSLPSEDDETAGEEGSDQWKSYFDTIFGKVSVGKINEFALKYKMSKEEEDDVLSNYEKFRGDLAKMLEFVMLSDEK
jgi:DnaJ family protein C protein 9